MITKGGMVRRIDKLGLAVLLVKMKTELRLENEDQVVISLPGKGILLRKCQDLNIFVDLMLASFYMSKCIFMSPIIKMSTINKQII